MRARGSKRQFVEEGTLSPAYDVPQLFAKRMVVSFDKADCAVIISAMRAASGRSGSQIFNVAGIGSGCGIGPMGI